MKSHLKKGGSRDSEILQKVQRGETIIFILNKRKNMPFISEMIKELIMCWEQFIIKTLNGHVVVKKTSYLQEYYMYTECTKCFTRISKHWEMGTAEFFSTDLDMFGYLMKHSSSFYMGSQTIHQWFLGNSMQKFAKF